MKKITFTARLVIFLLVLQCLFAGCSRKQDPAVNVLLVLNEVPLRISILYFEDVILARPELTALEKKYLKSAYRQEKDNFVLSVSPGDKVASGKTATHADEILRILRKLGTVPLFARPSDTDPVLSAREWTEAVCVDPVNAAREAVKSEDDKEKIVEWQKVKVDDGFRWVVSGNLLFKNTDETEGVVLKDIELFKYPVYGIANKIGRYERGMKVRSMGFTYPERVYRNQYINVEIYDKRGWCPAASVVLNARTSVMLRDESLFVNPEDLKSNKNANLRYSALDFVPVLEVRKDGWVKVVLDANDKVYYIKNGKEALSDDPLDIAFASYVRDDYRYSRTVSREIEKALSASGKRDALLAIPDIRKKLDALDLSRTRMEDYLGMDEYRNSAFVRSGSPFSLSAYSQVLFEIVNEAEYVLGSVRGSEQIIESKKGSLPVDEQTDGS